MSRRLNFDPNRVVAGRLILTDDDYEFTILDAKTFLRKKEDGSEVYGINYELRVDSDGAFAGKTFPYSLFMHTEKTEKMNKQFIMAAYGHSPKTESDFNEEYPAGDGWDLDWNDAETGAEEFIGDVWGGIVGRKIAASVITVPQKNNPSEQQNNFRWRSF